MAKKFVYITSNAGDKPALVVDKIVGSGSSLGEADGGMANAVITLRNIASDLDTIGGDSRSTIKNRSEISVPSPWAAILSFDTLMASKKEFGYLGELAVNQWRGLLTLIALKDFLDVDVTFHKINLKEKRTEINVNKFYSNLSYLKPKNQIFKNQNCWDEFVFIKCGKFGEMHNIGVLSNSGLVCPMYSYTNTNTSDILKEKGIMGVVNKKIDFIDPIPFITKNSIQYLYMRKWLQKISEILTNLSPDPNHYVTLNNSYIKSFIDDIDRAMEAVGEEEITKKRQLEENGFINFIYNIDEPSKISDIFDNLYPDINVEAVKPLIKVYTGRFGGPMYVVEELSKELKDFLVKNNAKMDTSLGFFSEQDIFLPELNLITNASGANISEFTDVFEGEEKKYVIWPINQTVFDIVEPYDITYSVRMEEILSGKFSEETESKIKVKIEKVNEEKYIAHIVFPIRREANGKSVYKQLHIKHEYSGENLINIFDTDIPFVAMWPYNKVKEQSKPSGANLWNEYYIHQTMPEAGNSSVRYTMEFKIGDKMIDSEDRFELDLAYGKTKNERYVYKCEDIPTHIIFYKSYIDGRTQEELGSFILPKPGNVLVNPNAGIEYTVAVDFGTTSTVVFYSTDEKGKKSEFVEFGKMYKFKEKGGNKFEVVDCDGNMSDNGLRVIYNNYDCIDDNKSYFVPYEYYNKKAYPSVYQNNSSNETASPKNLFSIGNVIFDYEVELSTNECIESEMKWGTSRKNKRSLNAYLSQIIKNVVYALICQKQACKFKWKFSYPTSLPEELSEEFKKITKSIIDSLKGSCDQSTFIFNPNSILYCSESIVSAKFFEDQAMASTCMLYGCIDIGGGSTDISFWKIIPGDLPKNLMQVSIYLASRLVFLDSISEFILSSADAENLTVLQKSICELNQKTYGKALESAINELNNGAVNRKEIMSKFKIDIEPAVFKFGERIMNIVEEGNKSEAIPFKQKLTLGFFAILYYAVKSLQFVKSDSENIKDINLYFAGNGSKMYNWIDNIYIINMRRALSDEIGINIHFQPLNENDLKTESSKGLLKLNKEAIENIDSENTEKMYNGEDVNIIFEEEKFEITSDSDLHEKGNSKYFDYFRANSSDQNNKYSFEISPELKNIKKFVDILNDKIFKNDERMVVDLTESEWENVYSSMKLIIIKNADEKKIDPLFIIGIQAVLEVLHKRQG